MARAKSHAAREPAPPGSTDNGEDVGLLAGDKDGAGRHHDDGDDDDLVVYPGEDDGGPEQPDAAAQRTPRTPNRVRFDLTPTVARFPGGGAAAAAANGHAAPGAARESFDLDEEDPAGRGSSASLRPLLTDIEAPSVALANSPWGGAGDGGDDDGGEDWRAELARPKSGLRSAFMNMANSIIGAGIIGQPYAFRQAGLLAGVALLVVLTVAVDWTICLIVVNSKLSGASSFQGTVEHCFGRPGLIAISLAQWVFAFGGMVAFGVIVGDSIPHVLSAVWPGLADIPVLGLLASRRAVIVVFVLGISYPLTLYRDIAKVGFLMCVALLDGGRRADMNWVRSWPRRARWLL
jgi:solute carrier family 38 (sodium-coupled neutral amino acid transporter), member 11